MKKLVIVALVSAMIILAGGGIYLLNKTNNDEQRNEPTTYISTELKTDPITTEMIIDTTSTEAPTWFEDTSSQDIQTATETQSETENQSASETQSDTETEKQSETEEKTNPSTEEKTDINTERETARETESVEEKIEETEAIHIESISAEVIGIHYIGDTLSEKDFQIRVWFSDNTFRDNPAGWAAYPLNLGNENNQIVVSYEGVSTTITYHAMKRPEQPTTDAETTTPGTTNPPATTQVPTTQAPTTQIPSSEQPTTQQTTTPPETTTQSSSGVIPYSNYLACKSAMDAINTYRSEIGVAPLTWSDGLYAAALIRAKQINDSGDYGHMKDIGGEIHAQTSTAWLAVDGWRQSHSHYEYMTKDKYNYCAVATYGNCTIAMFGKSRPILFNDVAFAEIMPAVENIFDGKMTLQEYESKYYPEAYAELMEVLNEE